MDHSSSRSSREIIEELKTQNKRLAIINQIAKSINIQMDYDAIIDQMAEPLDNVIDYDLLSFCLVEGEKLVIKSGLPKEQKLLGVGTELPKYNSAPWQAVEQRECFLRQDIPNDKRRYAEDNELFKVGIQSAIMAPMFNHGEVIGTLNFGSKATYAYSEKDFVFVQQLADQLAVSIQNLHLYSQVVRSKRDWEVTFKAVPDHIFLIDDSYQILRVNNDFKHAGASHLTGKKCHEIMPFCNHSCIKCPIKETFEHLKSVFREIHSNQKIYHIYIYPVFANGGEKDEKAQEMRELDKLVLYIKDVTEQKQMENQLFQTAKLAEIGEMAAGIAHELNSPLTAIVGNTDLLLRQRTRDSRENKLLKDVNNCGRRCKHIIQNLLTFSRQEHYSFDYVDINKIIENSLSLVSYQIEKNAIYLEKHLEKALPYIWGNEQELEQVIINFLINAKDAIKQDKTINRGVIQIISYEKEYQGKKVVQIEVKDNGLGVGEEIKDKIFNPFFTTKEVRQGTGMGLSVGLGIAKAHNGTIEVDSEPGAGSTFKLILPVSSAGGYDEI